MVPFQEPDAVFGVRALLRRINEAWLRGPRPDAESLLLDCFVDDVVFNGPGFVEVASGKSDCIAGYVEFANSAVIEEATLTDANVYCRGDSAVASYSWRLRYTIDGERYDESGHDVFMCVREGDSWKAAWRAMLPEMSAPGA